MSGFSDLLGELVASVSPLPISKSVADLSPEVNILKGSRRFFSLALVGIGNNRSTCWDLDLEIKGLSPFGQLNKVEPGKPKG